MIQQAFGLKARFPEANGTLKPGRFIWNGVLQPTPLSRTYRVEITHRARFEPTVRVLDTLETREGESLPHVYRGGTLCLYEPGDWNNSMSLADSIVPWTAEWLANYEIWLATGDWHGGGEWPPPRNQTDAANPTEPKDPPPAARG